MKKKYFLTLFTSIHIILIFLHIHKHTLLIKNNYTHQQCEKKIATLSKKKQMLTQTLYALQDRQAIKQYAQNQLRMYPYSLNQVKKIPLVKV